MKISQACPSFLTTHSVYHCDISAETRTSMNAFSQNAAHPQSRTKPDILAALLFVLFEACIVLQEFPSIAWLLCDINERARIYAESSGEQRINAREILSHACLRLRCESDNYSRSREIAIPRYKETNAMKGRYRRAWLAFLSRF